MAQSDTRNPARSHRTPWTRDVFPFGVCYYPEHWDEATRKDDIARMVASGVNTVRMAEFSWDLFEPERGRYRFEFYDPIIQAMSEAGISVILGTPTAAPPVWLTTRHPEVLRVDGKGVRQQHGSRQHACTTNPTFRTYCRDLVTPMAEHFKRFPGVIGWQVDNEFHCHFSECHCDACQVAFRQWLRTRYRGDLALLNETWGNRFWSQTLSDFDQVLTPREGLPTYPNPGARLDYLRFLSDAVTEFQAEQVAILRKTSPRWFVTHNGIFSNIDYRGPFSQDLDVLGVDVYPMFAHDAKERPYWQAHLLDRTRCLSGNFIIPEQQAGAGGQAPYLLDTPAPGEMRQMAWASVARGADGLLFFRWRTCRFGAEEYWCGILDHDNVPRRRYTELAEMGDEIKRLGPVVAGTSVRVDVAIAWGAYDSQCMSTIYRNGLPGDSGAVRALHKTFLKSGYATGLVHPMDDLSRVKLYVLPHWEYVDPAWVKPLRAWVEQGGVLVVGARSGTRDGRNRIVAETWPGCLRELAGVTVEEFGRLNHTPSRPVSIRLGSESFPAEHWYECLKPDPGTETMAVWDSPHLRDQPAITLRPVGSGHVVYVGTWFADQTAERLLPHLTSLSDVKPLPGSAPDIHVVCRERPDGRVWFLFNHSGETRTVTVPEDGIDVLSARKAVGSMELGPFGVAAIHAVTTG